LQLLFAGLLAGFEIAVHYGTVTSPEALGEAGEILLRQALTRRLRVLAPSIFLPSFLLALLVMVQEWRTPGLWFRGIGVAGLLVWILIRIVRTVPINSASMEWNPEAPPPNWRALTQTAEQFHVVAAWAAVLAFLCFLVSALQIQH